MTDKRENMLYDEKFDVEFDLFTLIEKLINAEWDSDTLKRKIESLMKQKNTLDIELFELDDMVKNN